MRVGLGWRSLADQKSAKRKISFARRDLSFSRSQLAKLGFCLIACLALTGCGGASRPYSTDAGAMKLVKMRLNSAVVDLNDLPAIPSTHPKGSAKFVGCTTDDSGTQLFQPNAAREWDLTGTANSGDINDVSAGGRAAATDIATALSRKGWSGSRKLDTSNTLELRKKFEGYTVTLNLQAFGDSVTAWALTTPRQVCKK